MFTIASGLDTFAIRTKDDLKDVPSTALVNTYNKLTGKTTSKFADRSKGIEQVWKQISHMAEDGNVHTVDNAGAAAAPKIAPAPEPAPAPAPEPKVAPKQPKAKKERAPRPRKKLRGMTFTLPVKDEVKQAREGSKRARVVELLSRPEGVTHAQVMAEIGWDSKTAYEGIRLVHAFLGFGLREDADGNIFLVHPKK